ncbi:exodeoxyribonuclease VII large subunit [Treponema sp. J25]|uniref:exodeoxyribonuclease VII large subunit n=1 Tax=Treponema sp. J25 TaxID=2094121 RepID=UPI0026D5B54D
MEQGRWKVPPEMPDGEGSLFVSKEGPMEDMSYGAEENLSPQVWTVSELTERIRACLEGFFPLVIVEGEISNYRPSSTGHMYFTLKDEGAAIQAVLFKNRQRALQIELRDGLRVRVRGSLSVYPQRGTYQIICETIEASGEGAILAMLEERKRRLAAEGLFDPAKKKPLPTFPSSVGIVSSPTGAAVRDILNILQRRARGIRIIIFPTPVQGTDAAPIIARRIEQANQWDLVEVLIVGRGGGSLEDLLPFSEEIVVRAIAASHIPVISAVGHEIDWALSDFAADVRAPTPSAAAELVSANREEALRYVQKLGAELIRLMQERLGRIKLLLRPFSLEDLEFRFRSILQPRLVRFDDAKEGLLLAMQERLSLFRQRLERELNYLETAHPRRILERGFSVVVNQRTGKVIRQHEEVAVGDTLSIRPLEGRITATVRTAERMEAPAEQER